MDTDNNFDVFISYSNIDKPIADIVCSELEKFQFTCWYAPRDIPPGESWPGSIVKAISSAKIVVLIFTATSNESDQVLKEIDRAITKKIKVIPFRVENKDLSPGLEYLISTCQWINAFENPIEEHATELRKAISKMLPPKQELLYVKGCIYKWLEVIDPGTHGEDFKVKCRNCEFVKAYDRIFNEHPPEICPVCRFDGEKIIQSNWYVIQPGGMGDRDIRCKKCRDIIIVSHYESDFKIPENCPTCHFSG